MSNAKEVEVTFQVPKDRTVTHAGKQMADGEKCKVTQRQAARLAERGLIKEKAKPPQSAS